MSRPRFLTDHDLNEHIITSLLRREPGIGIVRARAVGLHDAADSVVLDYATGNNLLVISHDVNTMPGNAYDRLARGEPTAELFLVSQARPVTAVVDDLILIWSASEAEEWLGRVVFLPI